MKYTYKILLQKHTDYPERIEETLNKLGEKGWELVNTNILDHRGNEIYNYPSTVFYFRKPVKEDNITL